MTVQPEETLERHSIDYIPTNARHGRPRDLFTIWFASNVNVGSAVTGALAVWIGLDLRFALLAIVCGNLIGAVFMAYHSVQGPRLGVPQMIQSRAQFGFLGAVLPMLITIAMYLGFQIEGGVVVGQALAHRTGAPQALCVVAFNSVAVLIALFGYRLIHRLSRVTTVVSGLIFAGFLVKLVSDLGSVHVPTHAATVSQFLLALSFSISWQITWAPYVSDYSRYLPEETSAQKTFWFTYAGSVISATLTMAIGALAVVVAGDAFGADALGYLTGLFGGLATVAFWLLIICGFGGASGPYGAFLTGFAALSGRGADPDQTPKVRAAFVIVFGAVAATLAIAASADLVTTFTNITLFLLYLLVPWTAINLTDYFLVRRGRYDIDQLFERHGRYGFLNAPAVVIYLVAILIQIPFINTPLYEGTIAKHLNGADIAWIVGLVFSALAYLVLSKSTATKRARSDVGSKSRSAASSTH